VLDPNFLKSLSPDLIVAYFNNAKPEDLKELDTHAHTYPMQKILCGSESQKSFDWIRIHIRVNKKISDTTSYPDTVISKKKNVKNGK
jgi:hypothetical protein